MELNETRERIIYQKDGPIARIILNWPEKANAQDEKLAARSTPRCTTPSATTASRS